MTIRDRIIAVLKDSPEGLDDDQLAFQLGLKQRQQANQRCRELQESGLVARKFVKGRLTNFWLGGELPSLPAVTVEPMSEKPWCWEGNVVRTIVEHLKLRHWTIHSVPDTATKAPGVDIHAVRNGHSLLIEVKGYPSTVYESGPKAGQPKRTNPPTQARHWAGEALLSALLRLQEDSSTQVAIAFPDFGVYHKLLSRIRKPLELLGIMVLIVSEEGTIHVLVPGRNTQEP